MGSLASNELVKVQVGISMPSPYAFPLHTLLSGGSRVTTGNSASLLVIPSTVGKTGHMWGKENSVLSTGFFAIEVL